MARTFNRNPLQVNTPSSKDVKNYFFNHYNWKGVNNDKNFLAVDQETFADAKNVYMDAEGLLKSRPSVKRKAMFSNSAVDFWNFDDVDVYLLKNKNEYQLNFVKNGETSSKSVTNENVKLVRIQNNIYCFTDNDFFYFNTENKEFGDGFDKVYIPNTTFDATGVKTDVEEKNILTNKEKYTYLYNSEFGIFTEAYGKDLSVEINGRKYQTVLDKYSLETLTDVIFKIPENYDYMAVSKKNTYVFYSNATRTISYSSTGKVLSKSFDVPMEFGSVTSYPKFSQDSNYIIIGTDKSLYIVSVVDDSSSGQLRFPNLTDVASYLNFEYGDNENSTHLYGGYDFITYDEFIFFENITFYPDVGEPGRTSRLIYVNSSEIKYFITGLMEIKGLAFEKNYKLYSNSGDALLDGLVAVYGIGGWPLSLISFNNSDIVHSYYPPADYKGINDIKIVGDRIIFLENFENSEFGGRRAVTLSPKDNPTNESSTELTDTFDLTKKRYSLNYKSTNQFDFISNDGNKVLFNDGVYFLREGVLKKLIPDDVIYKGIHYGDYLYYFDEEGNVFSNLIENNLHFDYIKDGTDNLLKLDLFSRLGNFYLVSDKTIFISDYREEDGEFRWYLPETHKQTFDKTITGLQPISSSEMGVFFDDEIWYVHKNENVYYGTKTKLELGVKFGSDITTSYDGSRLIFPTERGIVSLSYQDFVASTDQVLTFLSDAIHLQMKEFCKQPVSIFKNDYWIFVYQRNLDKLYLLDMRNNSWWPWSLSNKVKKFINYNDEMIFLSTNGFFRFDESTENYFDYNGERHLIDWSITSQKLHLSQVNNYKHVINMTFNSVIDTEDYLTFFLDIKNYREFVDEGKLENVRYNVDVLRTFIQRLNYFKVNEFQYTLRSDNANRKPLPLSLSSINIKYKIQGQVR